MIELRQNKWQQRQAFATIQAVPKTIKEIHEEMERQSKEQLETEQARESSLLQKRTTMNLIFENIFCSIGL